MVFERTLRRVLVSAFFSLVERLRAYIASIFIFALVEAQRQLDLEATINAKERSYQSLD